MARPAVPDPDDSVTLAVRVPRKLLPALDTALERLRAKVPESLREKLTRSDALRDLITRAATAPAPTSVTRTTSPPPAGSLRERCARAQEAVGLSNVKLAEAVDVSEATIRRWRKGVRELDPDVAQRVLAHLEGIGF